MPSSKIFFRSTEDTYKRYASNESHIIETQLHIPSPDVMGVYGLQELVEAKYSKNKYYLAAVITEITEE